MFGLSETRRYFHGMAGSSYWWNSGSPSGARAGGDLLRQAGKLLRM